MRVLHFIPNFANVAKSVGLSYKLNLIKVMAERADVHLLCSDYPTEDMGNVNVHKFSPLKNIFGGRFSSFDRFLSEIQPDIVHIHACWSFYAYCFQRRCEKYRIPTVVTFDRHLETWHLSYHYWSRKLPKCLVYQRYVVSHAKALHAVCSNEVFSISRFTGSPVSLYKAFNINHYDVKEDKCLHALNKDDVKPGYNIYLSKVKENVRYIFDIDVFCRDKNKSFSAVVDNILNMYQVIMDSNPFMLMDSNDCLAEDTLLSAGIVDDFEGKNVSDDKKQLLSSLTDNSLRKILIHSTNEGILDYIFNGAKKYSLILPYTKEQISNIFCLPKECRNTDIGSRKIENIKSDATILEPERKICIKILTVLYSIKHNKSISRLDFAELFCYLKYNNYDEALLYTSNPQPPS